MSTFEQSLVQDLQAAAARLQTAQVPLEALAEYIPEHRRLLVKRAATMQHIGEVWRLGVLLLAPPEDDAGSTPTLFAAHFATRAAVRLHPGNQSISREERRDIAASAIKGGYSEGTAVNFDATEIVLTEASLRSLGTDAPVGVIETQAGPELRVRWRAGASLDGAPALAAYLGERIDLLIGSPL